MQEFVCLQCKTTIQIAFVEFNLGSKNKAINKCSELETCIYNALAETIA